MRGLPVALAVVLGAAGCSTFEGRAAELADGSDDKADVVDANLIRDASLRDASDGGITPLTDAQNDAPPGTDHKTPCTAGRRVFIASQGFSPKFGGASGGDALCEDLAKNANLGGRWFAWLSSNGRNAIDLMPPQTPYYLLDCVTQVAGSKVLLANGVLAHGIDRDEKWGLVGSTQAIWTGTRANGTFSGDACNDWTSSDFGPQATVGYATYETASWTRGEIIDRAFCSLSARIYCFEKL